MIHLFTIIGLPPSGSGR